MITYKPFFETLKKRNITTYYLVTYYDLSRSLLDRLKHNRPITTATIESLYKMLNCRVQDILLYEPDGDATPPTTVK
ncbi:MAG: helix-turn-helix transcriptional regulator [Lachnospiraceae bacterium]|nr:helix-turn-helix transcriptional regulator [Lachnospiraceae bacterium]